MPLIDDDFHFSKDGFLFDKEAILQYIITKKNEYSRKMKEYERQKKLEDNEESDNNALAEQKKLQKFINTEQNITTLDQSILLLFFFVTPFT